MSEQIPEDFIDIVACLRAEGAEFLVVGAHALAVHGSPRATGDLDLFIDPTPHNAERVYRALIVNKRASGRLKDLANAEALEEIRRRR